MENQFGKLWGAEWASRALSLIISPGSSLEEAWQWLWKPRSLGSSLRAHLLFGRCHRAQKEKNDQQQQFSCSWHKGRTSHFHKIYPPLLLSCCSGSSSLCKALEMFWEEWGVSPCPGALCAAFDLPSCWYLWGSGNSRDCSWRAIPRENPPQCHAGGSTGRELLLCSRVMPGIWQSLFQNRNAK